MNLNRLYRVSSLWTPLSGGSPFEPVCSTFRTCLACVPSPQRPASKPWCGRLTMGVVKPYTITKQSGEPSRFPRERVEQELIPNLGGGVHFGDPDDDSCLTSGPEFKALFHVRQLTLFVNSLICHISTFSTAWQRIPTRRG